MSRNDPKAYTTSTKMARELGRDPDRDKRRFDPLLDKKTDRHPILDDLMDEALRQIMLTADGATASLQTTVIMDGGRDSKGKKPMSGLAEEVEELGLQYMAAKTHRNRMKAIKKAQDFAVRLRHSPRLRAYQMRGTKEWRESIATDPRPHRVIALDHQISSKTIAAIRKEFGASKPLA